MVKRKKLALGVTAGVAAVGVGVSAVFAILATNHAGAFEQIIDGDCAPLVTIAFRGSGEGNLTPDQTSNTGAPFTYGDSSLVTNGWESITLTNLLDELSRTEYEGFRGESIPVIPVGPAADDEPYGYDAILAALEASSLDSALTYEGSKLLYSAVRGAEAATHLINDYLLRSEGCPILPKFVVVGYSQGAMAARHTAELNPESVIGVVKIGDPYQKPEGVGVRASGASGVGIIRWKASEDQRRSLDAFYGLVPFTSSICHGGDPICDFTPVEGLWKLASGTYGDHMDYYTGSYPDEAPQDAKEIARLAYQQQLLAQQAKAAGESVSLDEVRAAASGDYGLRGVSLSFAGSPTLFSALSPELLGRQVNFDFDLDGDGVYETRAPGGTVWVTFEDEGPHTIGVRITEVSTGTTTEQRRTVTVGPRGGADVSSNDFQPTSGEVDPPAAPATPAPTSTRPTPEAAPVEIHTPPATGGGGGQEGDGSEDGGEDGSEGGSEDGSGGDDDSGSEDGGGEDDGGGEEPGYGPALAFSDEPLFQGSPFTMHGSGFTPDSSVIVRGRNFNLLEEVPTDEDGNFELMYVLPDDIEPGEYWIDIEDESVHSYQFTVVEYRPAT